MAYFDALDNAVIYADRLIIYAKWIDCLYQDSYSIILYSLFEYV